MNWKETIMSKFKVISQHSPGGTEQNHEKPQNSWFPGQDLNPGPPEYKVGVSTIRPWRSVTRCDSIIINLSSDSDSDSDSGWQLSSDS
jgi:hypothetical protein